MILQHVIKLSAEHLSAFLTRASYCCNLHHKNLLLLIVNKSMGIYLVSFSCICWNLRHVEHFLYGVFYVCIHVDPFRQFLLLEALFSLYSCSYCGVGLVPAVIDTMAWWLFCLPLPFYPHYMISECPVWVRSCATSFLFNGQTHMIYILFIFVASHHSA